MFVYGDSNILGSNYGVLLCSTLESAYVITLGFCEGTEMGSPDGFINSFDDGIPVGS